MDKFKMTVTLKSGKTVKCRFRSRESDLAEIFALIQRAWREGLRGYVTFGDHTFQIVDISSYSVTPAWFI